MYENAKYIVNTWNDKIVAIGVFIDGFPSSVPLDPLNTDYQNIMKLVGEGKLVIAPAEESDNAG